MKKYKIAFTGVFDLANYGDHLFPLIFNKIIENEEEQYEMYLFSPFSGRQAFDENIEVYSLFDLEKMHKMIGFDAIVVGGGEVIHLHSFKHMYENEYIEYPIYNCWVIPSIVAKKNNILLLWNNPGIPFEFSNIYKRAAKTLMDEVDYLSVRNLFSLDSLLKIGIQREKINLCPDTAFLLPKIYKESYLKKICKKLLGENKEKYVVFQCNRLIDENSLNIAINALENLKKEGYQIVLLPLAYTNGDDIFESEINRKIGKRFYEFDRKLSLEEIISVLACCEMYIGVSFHGAITAYSYGKCVVGFDFFANKKTKDLFDTMGIPEFYITDALKLDKTINEAFAIKKDLSSYRWQIEKDLEEHFKNIKRFLTAEKKEQEIINEYKILSDIIADVSNECRDNEGELNEKNVMIKSLQEYMYIMQLEIEKKKATCNELEKERRYIKSIIGEKKYNRILERAIRKNED